MMANLKLSRFCYVSAEFGFGLRRDRRISRANISESSFRPVV